MKKPNGDIYNSSICQGLFKTALDAIIIINPKGIIQDINPAAIKLFGYTKKEIVGLNIKTLIPEHYAKHHDAPLKNYLQSKKQNIMGIELEIEAQHKNGTMFPANLSLNEATFDHQKIFIAFLRDITTQTQTKAFLIKQAEHLTRLNSKLESFSYSVSHDLNTPLRHIIGYIQLLENQIQPIKDKSVKKYINIIHDEAIRMECLIQSLLMFSRLGRASFELTFRTPKPNFFNLIQ